MPQDPASSANSVQPAAGYRRYSAFLVRYWSPSTAAAADTRVEVVEVHTGCHLRTSSLAAATAWMAAQLKAEPAVSGGDTSEGG